MKQRTENLNASQFQTATRINADRVGGRLCHHSGGGGDSLGCDGAGEGDGEAGSLSQLPVPNRTCFSYVSG